MCDSVVNVTTWSEPVFSFRTEELRLRAVVPVAC
jgi:hypothetical protein